MKIASERGKVLTIYGYRKQLEKIFFSFRENFKKSVSQNELFSSTTLDCLDWASILIFSGLNRELLLVHLFSAFTTIFPVSLPSVTLGSLSKYTILSLILYSDFFFFFFLMEELNYSVPSTHILKLLLFSLTECSIRFLSDYPPFLILKNVFSSSVFMVLNLFCSVITFSSDSESLGASNNSRQFYVLPLPRSVQFFFFFLFFLRDKTFYFPFLWAALKILYVFTTLGSSISLRKIYR